MKRLFAIALICFASLAQADLSSAQRVTFAAAVNAETNAGLVACRTIRDDTCIQAFYNASTSNKAWRESVTAKEVFEAMNLPNFDGLSAGKRDAMRTMLDFAPLDFSRQKVRKAISDIWTTATDRDAILNAATENASRFEMIFAGASATEGTVTAVKRNVLGPVSINDVSNSLNGY